MLHNMVRNYGNMSRYLASDACLLLNLSFVCYMLMNIKKLFIISKNVLNFVKNIYSKYAKIYILRRRETGLRQIEANSGVDFDVVARTEKMKKKKKKRMCVELLAHA